MPPYKRQLYPQCGYRNCKYYKSIKHNKKPLNKADKYLLLSIITLLLFTVTAIVMNFFGKDVQEQLIIGVYAFFGTEIGACCVIKVINIKNEASAPCYYEGEENVDTGAD